MIHKMRRWFGRLFGPGHGTWPCNAKCNDHNCDETPHQDYKHRCGCGFRWAA